MIQSLWVCMCECVGGGGGALSLNNQYIFCLSVGKIKSITLWQARCHVFFRRDL